jgi:FlaG/FlaF family flagellin (archaellin)
MKENSDENRDAVNPRIDELLNSFIDAELTTSQQAEVERLIAQDARVAQRLRQLQRCRALIGSLPCAEVPAEVVEGIRASLAGMTIPDETYVSDDRAGKRHLLVRRVLSAAAMIGLVAVLAAVIYTILIPRTASQRPAAIETRQASTPTRAQSGAGTVASLGFSGRLELTTSDLAAVSAFVTRAIEDKGLSNTGQEDQHLYSLSCTTKQLNGLLADLATIWPQLDSATLFVNTRVFNKPVAVKNVTTEQIAQIADQNNLQKRIEAARGFDAVNTMFARLPGREITSAIQGENKNPVREWRVPKPVLTTGSRKTVKKPQNEAQEKQTIHLTIVVNG